MLTYLAHTWCSTVRRTHSVVRCHTAECSAGTTAEKKEREDMRPSTRRKLQPCLITVPAGRRQTSLRCSILDGSKSITQRLFLLFVLLYFYYFYYSTCKTSKALCRQTKTTYVILYTQGLAAQPGDKQIAQSCSLS